MPLWPPEDSEDVAGRMSAAQGFLLMDSAPKWTLLPTAEDCAVPGWPDHGHPPPNNLNEFAATTPLGVAAVVAAVTLPMSAAILEIFSQNQRQ